jgi:hypothetical protein
MQLVCSQKKKKKKLCRVCIGNLHVFPVPPPLFFPPFQVISFFSEIQLCVMSPSKFDIIFWFIPGMRWILIDNLSITIFKFSFSGCTRRLKCKNTCSRIARSQKILLGKWRTISTADSKVLTICIGLSRTRSLVVLRKMGVLFCVEVTYSLSQVLPLIFSKCFITIKCSHVCYPRKRPPPMVNLFRTLFSLPH